MFHTNALLLGLSYKSNIDMQTMSPTTRQKQPFIERDITKMEP